MRLSLPFTIEIKLKLTQTFTQTPTLPYYQKTKMKGAVISVFVMLAMFQFMVKQGDAAVSCDQVRSSLVNCVPFLTGTQAVPTAACCIGVSRLQTIAVTTADKQAACNCVKDTAASMPSIKEDAAASLPTKCNVQINFPISRNTDCKNIQQQAAVNCVQVRSSLVGCIPYLTGNVAVPSAACCTGVSRLPTIAVTTADKQAACNCVKDTAASMPTIKEDAAASLPAKCNVQVNFPISKNTDCSKIQ
ncbi:lipid transfer protein 3 [Hibiscus trionum]|uniref:Non-specific lipid-transfer protein n=1 Tax=Hibiscus trionum TaxID=183268 RepID=A0A9W7GXE2_HIBTR|nr:lipid transfer protein 3 [Hibiscus trionum]